MRGYAISGSWRRANEELKRDVEETVGNILWDGNGIVTGGALGVDQIATETVLNHPEANPAEQLRIYLPVELEKYLEHICLRAQESFKEKIKAVTMEQAASLDELLTFIKQRYPRCIRDDSEFTKVNQESYYARIDKIVRDSHELYAFQVNDSQGVQYSIDKAIKSRKLTHVKKYHIR